MFGQRLRFNRPQAVAVLVLFVAIGISSFSVVRAQRFALIPNGITACSTGRACVEGDSKSKPWGVFGVSVGSNGVEGESFATGESGVVGLQRNDGNGLYGESHDTSGKYAALFVRGDESTTNIFYGYNESTKGSCLIDPSAKLTCNGAIEASPQKSEDIAVLGNSPAAYGVEGISKSADGVHGVTDSTTGNSGVAGLANGHSGSAYGVFGSSNNGTDGVGVYGTSKGYGVEGVSAFHDGVHGVTSSTTGSSGVAGIATGSSGHANGVYGSSSNGVGIYGTSSTYGVEGVGSGEYNHSAGVYGTSPTYGVEGISGGYSGSSGQAAGVYGSSIKYGVYGTGYIGVEGYAKGYSALEGIVNSPNSGLALQTEGCCSGSGGSCEIDFYGNEQCTGQITGGQAMRTLHRTSSGTHVLAFGSESTSATIEDFGTGQMMAGFARVHLDPAFASTIDGSRPYYVFLTPLGDTRGLYVSEKAPSSFVVRETGHGRSTLGFDYRIIAHPLDAKGGRLTVAQPLRLQRAPSVLPQP